MKRHYKILLGCLVFLMGGIVCATSVGATEAPSFPVTIRHDLGTTTIAQEPKRIVTIGWSSEDAVLALGKVPVAMPRYSFFESGIFPWNEPYLDGYQPVLLAGKTVDFERVAMLRPDLILATSSDISEQTWRRLSSIAPTVAYRHGAFRTDWREQAELVGAALGKLSEAKALVEKTDAYLNEAGATFPQLKGKTFTFGTFFPGESNVVVYLPSDPRVAALMNMGLKASPGVERLAEANPGITSTSVSLERIGRLDADILLMWYGTGARQAAEAQPLFASLPAVQRGSYVAMDDPVEIWSTSALSVSSIPYGFPKFLPRLAEAARKADDARQ